MLDCMNVVSDRLACFLSAIDAGCAHSYIVVSKRKPRGLPQFRRVKTVLTELETLVKSAHKSFNCGKYAGLLADAVNHRFIRRFDLAKLVTDVTVDAVRS